MRRVLTISLAALVVITLTASCKDKKKDNDGSASGTTTTAIGDTTSTDATSEASTTTAPNPVTTTPAATGGCKVLTKSNIERSLGITVGDGKPGATTPNTARCTWETADHKTTVTVVRYASAPDLVQQTKDADANAKPVSGVGDDAVIDVAKGQVVAQFGDVGMNLTVAPAPSEGPLTTLARTATSD
jgi:hypothetical protein